MRSVLSIKNPPAESMAASEGEAKVEIVLSAKNLKVSIQGREILHELSLKVPSGAIVGIIGPNGSGKTTFLRTCAGLLRPISGSVCLQGANIGELSPVQISRLVAYMPQVTERHSFRVIDTVIMGRYPRLGRFSIESKHDKNVAQNALQAVGMAHTRDRPFAELSGGEQRLVVLARAIAQQTNIVLLDEPVAALDLKHQLTAMKILQDSARNGAAVLLTMHDLSMAARYCDLIALLFQGRIAAFGEPEQVIHPDLIKSAFEVEVLVESSTFDGVPQVIPIRSVDRK